MTCGIHPVRADAVLELLALLRRRGALRLAEELGLDGAAVRLDERDDGLAGDVAAHDDHGRAVDRGRVEELAPQDLGPVDVGRVVDPELAPGTVRVAAPEQRHHSGGNSRYASVRSIPWRRRTACDPK
jgi:hypothetical protein